MLSTRGVSAIRGGTMNGASCSAHAVAAQLQASPAERRLRVSARQRHPRLRASTKVTAGCCAAQDRQPLSVGSQKQQRSRWGWRPGGRREGAAGLLALRGCGAGQRCGGGDGNCRGRGGRRRRRATIRRRRAVVKDNRRRQRAESGGRAELKMHLGIDQRPSCCCGQQRTRCGASVVSGWVG